jgi:hypothetical protein
MESRGSSRSQTSKKPARAQKQPSRRREVVTKSQTASTC